MLWRVWRCKRPGAVIVELLTLWFSTKPAGCNSGVALGSPDQVSFAVMFLTRRHMLPRARIVREIRGILGSLVDFPSNYKGSVVGWNPEPLWHILPWLPIVCASGNLLKKTRKSSKQAVEPREVWCIAMATPPCSHIMSGGNEQVKFWGYTFVCRGAPCFGSRVPHSGVATNLK